MEEALAYLKECQDSITKEQKEHHSNLMSKLELFSKISTRKLSNNELWMVLNDIYALIEFTVTFDKECLFFDDEMIMFCKLRKNYDLRVEIYLKQIKDTKGGELVKRSRKTMRY